MKSAIFKLAVSVACIFFSMPVKGDIRVHCAHDTVVVADILRTLSNPVASPSSLIVEAAQRLENLPYENVYDNDSVGSAMIYLHGFDDMSFLTTVAALAKTAASPMPRVRDFATNLVDLGYRHGNNGDFSDKLLYGADWVVDNSYRKNVEELTDNSSNPVFKTKSIDYISHHRDLYRPLRDSMVYEKLKLAEMGYRLHKIPHMRPESAGKSEIIEDMRDGDIIMVLSREPDMDTYTMGFVVMREDGPHLIHASKDAGKVVEEPLPLAKYLKKEAKRVYGYRRLRLNSSMR